jgi:translation initiation factor 3 subunit C
VKSQKDKAWDSMRDSIKRLRSAMKINDWSAILDEFKNTNKIIEKSKMLILKNGLPKFYVKMLMDLEDFLVETLKDKEAIKKMKKEIGKAFNTMKLSLRKHNKDYENEIAACRANPTEYVEASSSESEDSSEEDEDSDEDEDEDDDDSDSDSSEEPVKKPAAKPATATKPVAKPAAKPVKVAAPFFLSDWFALLSRNPPPHLTKILVKSLTLKRNLMRKLTAMRTPGPLTMTPLTTPPLMTKRKAAPNPN